MESTALDRENQEYALLTIIKGTGMIKQFIYLVLKDQIAAK
jgi:hypothetical protein